MEPRITFTPTKYASNGILNLSLRLYTDTKCSAFGVYTIQDHNESEDPSANFITRELNSVKEQTDVTRDASREVEHVKIKCQRTTTRWYKQINDVRWTTFNISLALPQNGTRKSYNHVCQNTDRLKKKTSAPYADGFTQATACIVKHWVSRFLNKSDSRCLWIYRALATLEQPMSHNPKQQSPIFHGVLSDDNQERSAASHMGDVGITRSQTTRKCTQKTRAA